MLFTITEKHSLHYTKRDILLKGLQLTHLSKKTLLLVFSLLLLRNVSDQIFEGYL